MIIHAFMVPHPPIAVSEIGKGEEKRISDTLFGFAKVADIIANIQPDTIVISSPHAIMYRDWFSISSGEAGYGDFGQFRAKDVSFEQPYDIAFIHLLDKRLRQEEFPGGTGYDRQPELDHGVMVPLYFINQKYTGYKLVRVGLSGLPLTMHYELGKHIAQVSNELNRRVVFIGSGDLSHCQKSDGPYGYHEEGPLYDEKIMATMSSANFEQLFSYSPNLLSKSMECGHRSFVIMAGALDQLDVKPTTFCHEATFGVGYGIVSYEVLGPNKERNMLTKYLSQEKERIARYRENADELVKLAYDVVENWLAGKKNTTLPSIPRKAGVFVSIHEFGELRGCIGTISPCYGNISQEIQHNAISACSRDPRFSPIEQEEFPYLEISVDELKEAERIPDKSYLDVKKYGVICSSKDGRRGLLLPDLEGVDTVEQQIEIACRKGGIQDDEEVILERFEVIRHA